MKHKTVASAKIIVPLFFLFFSLASTQLFSNIEHSQHSQKTSWLLLAILISLVIVAVLLSINILFRRRTNLTFLKNQAMLTALVDNIPFDVWAMDNQERYTMQNATSKKNWGDIIGKTPTELGIPQETIEKWREQRMLAMTGQIIKEEISIEKNGETHHISNFLAPVRIGGKINGVLGVAIDITNRVAAEENKKKLEQQLFQTQKLESIGRLTGGIAHDFNNMLSPIIGYTELILKNKNQASETKFQHAQDILDAAQSAKSLIKQLLAFSRSQQLDIHVVEINEIIQNFSKIIRRSIREDINIEYDFSDDLHNIEADASQIEQILLNLAVNAQDAMPHRGQILIKTANVEMDESYSQRKGEIIPGQYAMLSVADSGEGMNQETLDSIFEPFFTTKAIGTGTGLGLATVYGIVKQHNGYIFPYSEPGHGTVFKIYFPITQQESSQKKQTLHTTTHLGHGETILLVEDNDLVREVTLAMLKDFNYKLLVATNGVDALNLVQNLTKPIDLLLTDMIMPEMNGVELYKQLSQKYPGLRVLYMSGYTANVIAEHKIEEKDINFIHKPFSMNELGSTLQQILNNT